MTRIFFDIEIYSTGERPKYSEKVIALAYKKDSFEVTVLKEWETSEKEVLSQFLKEVIRNPGANLIGHNIFRFDIPVLFNRATAHGLGSLDELMNLLLNASYPIDTIQALLPTNNFYFKGLGLSDCVKKIGVETQTCSSSEIKTKYDEGDYDAIAKHVIEDVLKTERLYTHLEQLFKSNQESPKTPRLFRPI